MITSAVTRLGGTTRSIVSEMKRVLIREGCSDRRMQPRFRIVLCEARR